MNDWSVGITEFSTNDYYVTRHTEQECDRCGAKPGFYCFEMVSNRYGHMKPYPVQSHIVQRPHQKGEIPIENQAMSSGRLRSGC